jgi:hypothetical protein
LQRPLAAAFRRVATGQFDQPLFDVPLDLNLVRPLRLRPGVQGRRQAGGDQAPADTADRTEADAEGRDNRVIDVAAPRGGVCQKEDAGMGEPAGRTRAHGDQPLERGPLIRRQRHSVLVHRSLRDPGKGGPSPKLRIAYCLSIEDWRHTSGSPIFI